MGACSSHEEINASSKKLIRAIYVADKSKQAKGLVQMYDVENNESLAFNIKLFPFKNLETVSQITIDNCLYLLGEQGNNVKNGSIFVKIDITAKMNQINILINSTHEHYKPSMSIFKKDFIVAAAGKGSKKCEIYHRNSNKWRTLPDLPEERYGCNMMSDDKNDLMYCFGGYDSKNKTYIGNVIRINLKSSTSWEVISSKNNSLLERSFYAITRTSKDTLLIIGGSVNGKEYSDDILEYDFVHKSTMEMNYRLMNPARFDVYSYSEYISNLYLVDDDNVIHRIIKREGKTEVINNFKDLSPNLSNYNTLG